MRDEQRDALRLEHILNSIDRLTSADEDNALNNISEKDLSYFGVVKLLEIIGEAAYKLSVGFKESHLSTPWKYIIAMRHILVHGYYQINREDVLKTIREDLPLLRSQVWAYLQELEGN